MTTIIYILPTESKERDKVMTLTTFLIGLAISCIGGILGTIFFPETEEIPLAVHVVWRHRGEPVVFRNAAEKDHLCVYFK